MSKRTRIGIIVGIAAAIIIAAVIVVVFVVRQPEVRTAIVVLAEGLVEVRFGQDGSFIAALVDMLLKSGDLLRTGEDGHSVIEMDTGLVLVVAPNSTFSVAEMEGEPGNEITRLLLNAGEVFSVSRGELPEEAIYEVETPVGIIGIRGSSMSARYDPDSDSIEATCLNGSCTVSADGDEIDLSGNQWIGVTADEGIVGDPAPMTPEQLDRWDKAIEKAEQAGLGDAFGDQCSCQAVSFWGNDLVCKDGTMIPAYLGCGEIFEIDLHTITTINNGRANTITNFHTATNLPASAVLLEAPDGSEYIATLADVESGVQRFIYDLDGEPISGEAYRFTLLDAAGQPIPNKSRTDTWTACTLEEPPRNLVAEVTPEMNLNLSWEIGTGARGYDIFLQNHPGPVTPFQIFETQGRTLSLLWTDEEGEFSLSSLPDGKYDLEVVGHSYAKQGVGVGRECSLSDYSESLTFTKSGDTITVDVTCRCDEEALYCSDGAVTPESPLCIPIPYGETTADETHIVVDGQAGDWAGREVLREDPVGEAEEGFLDLQNVYAFANQQALYVLVEVVDPAAPFENLEIEILADDKRYSFGWQPGAMQGWIGDVTGGEYVDLGPAENSSYALEAAFEARIDLEDAGLPERVKITAIRAWVGECCEPPEWREADLVGSMLVPVVNEIDAPPPTVPYGEEPDGETDIVIDGDGSDWADREVLLDDPAGDAEEGFLDLAAGYAFVNQEALYVLIEAVDPGAPLVQFDLDIWVDDRLYVLSMNPADTFVNMGDVTGDTYEDIGGAFNSTFVLGSVFEARIDLRDLGLPEMIRIRELRVMVGECCEWPEWRDADVWQPYYTPVVNEVDRR